MIPFQASNQANSPPAHPYEQVLERRCGLTPPRSRRAAQASKLVETEHQREPLPARPACAVAAMQAEPGRHGGSLRLYPDPNAERLAGVARHFAADGITPAHVSRRQRLDEGAGIFRVCSSTSGRLLPGHHLQLYRCIAGSVWRRLRRWPLNARIELVADDYLPASWHLRRHLSSPEPNAPTGRRAGARRGRKIDRRQPGRVVVAVSRRGLHRLAADRRWRWHRRHPTRWSYTRCRNRARWPACASASRSATPDLIDGLGTGEEQLQFLPARPAWRSSAPLPRSKTGTLRDHAPGGDPEPRIARRRNGEAGFSTPASAANFVFSRHPQHDAATLVASCANAASSSAISASRASSNTCASPSATKTNARPARGAAGDSLTMCDATGIEAERRHRAGRHRPRRPCDHVAPPGCAASCRRLSRGRRWRNCWRSPRAPLRYQCATVAGLCAGRCRKGAAVRAILAKFNSTGMDGREFDYYPTQWAEPMAVAPAQDRFLTSTACSASAKDDKAGMKRQTGRNFVFSTPRSAPSSRWTGASARACSSTTACSWPT